MSEKVLKGKISTLNYHFDKIAILKPIVENLNITQKEISNRVGKSERTVKNKVVSFKEKGYIPGLNGKKEWEILIDEN